MILLGLALMLATRLLELPAAAGAAGAVLFLIGALPLLLGAAAQLEPVQD